MPFWAEKGHTEDVGREVFIQVRLVWEAISQYIWQSEVSRWYHEWSIILSLSWWYWEPPSKYVSRSYCDSPSRVWTFVVDSSWRCNSSHPTALSWSSDDCLRRKVNTTSGWLYCETSMNRGRIRAKLERLWGLLWANFGPTVICENAIKLNRSGVVLHSTYRSGIGLQRLPARLIGVRSTRRLGWRDCTVSLYSGPPSFLTCDQPWMTFLPSSASICM